MSQKSTWLERKLDRLDYLAELFYRNGFTQISDEIRSMQTETEVKNFYNAIKGWLF